MAMNSVQSGLHLTSGTTTIKSSPGILSAIVVNKALSGTVTLTDGATTLAILTNGTTAPLGAVQFGSHGIAFGTNLKVALSGTEDITVVYE